MVDEPSFTGAYSLDVSSQLGVVNWRDVFGKWSPSVRLSNTKLRRTQDYGAFNMLTQNTYGGGQAQRHRGRPSVRPPRTWRCAGWSGCSGR